MNTRLDIKEAYATAFRNEGSVLSGHDVEWLQKARAEAIAAFQEQGFPAQKAEAWRYTNLKPLLVSTYDVPTPTPEASQLPDGLPDELPDPLTTGPRLVFVNGQLVGQSGGAGISGLRVDSLAALLRDAPDDLVDLFESGNESPEGPGLLNSAFMQDGYIIRIDDGASVDAPIEIVHWSSCDSPQAFHGRNFIVAGANSRATIIERYFGSGEYWSNVVSGITLGTSAHLQHYIQQREAADAVHMMRRDIALSADSSYLSFALSMGASVARDETHLAFLGEGANATIDGVFLASENQSRDTLIVADHRIGNTSSNQRFKGVLAGRAKGTFQGRIQICKDAAGTEAHQSCNSLILERGAEANAKPELLIYADDVKCSHGATVGELDKVALFYLLSRGVTPEMATSMLVEAFASSVVETIEMDAVRDAFAADVAGWMAGRRGDAGVEQ